MTGVFDCTKWSFVDANGRSFDQKRTAARRNAKIRIPLTSALRPGWQSRSGQLSKMMPKP